MFHSLWYKLVLEHLAIIPESSWMAIALAQAQAQLDAALAARLKILASEEYRIGGMQVRRSLLRDADASIAQWESRVAALESAASRGARMRRRFIVPRDS